ncbi:hypothetical protein V2J09_010096 [Rumex salicifolius]
MSHSELNRMLACPDFDQQQGILDALEAPYGGTPRRDYNQRPIKVVLLELPEPCCVVYFDLKKEECLRLFPSNYLRSQEFCVGVKRHTLLHYFRLCVTSYESDEDCIIDIGLALRKNPSKEFVNLHITKISNLSQQPGFRIQNS